MKEFKLIIITSFILFFSGCATFKMQVANKKDFVKPNSEVLHSFYLIGDAGNSTLKKDAPALVYLKKEIKDASKKSTLLFLGDNVYEKGIPKDVKKKKKKKRKKYKLAKHRLEVQSDIAKKFKGNSIFIPGNHDWYSGLEGLSRQEKLVKDALGKNSFFPENGCPLARVEISKNIDLIIVDTHWYVTNWNKHPTINDNCEIKTRAKFFDEFEGLIKKARGKTTIVALHHPMFTNGPHGGYYTFNSHLKPVPLVGTLKNVLRKTTGITDTDQQNTMYNELRQRIITISQENEKVIFVSGHEHSLQYIVRDNLPQIVSGSGSKQSGVKNTNGGLFSYGAQGFARLDIYKNGASSVHFYTVKDNKAVFEANVFKADSLPNYSQFTNYASTKTKASIYTKEEVTKSKFYKFLWGERYRKYFGTEILAPKVNLDTLYGGLKPIRRGGGHQSKSLRLEDKKGRQYVMRALRKNAVQYLQAVLFKDQYVEGQFDETLTESLLMDVFTGSHPFAPFAIDKLAEAVDVYHTKPVLFYVPKQQSLGEFNTDYGNELYMIEERTDDGHSDKKHFGYSNKLLSTDDFRKNLAADEKYALDEESYIRARLFDMLIGDWDRHQDQWRWAEFKENGKIIYRPVPRDRDQAFSIFGDGFLLNFLTNSMPGLRGMRSYSEDLKDPKWFSYSAYPLDMALIKNADKKVWDAQVAKIQTQITDEVIEEAFKKFPSEVHDETVIEIKQKLKGRKANLQKISDLYYNHLNKFSVITGTNKDDWFDIKRLENGNTQIAISRINKGEKSKVILNKIYDRQITKEIWIYGLDDEDVFHVNGAQQGNPIKIKLIGGLNKDTYKIDSPKGVKVFDQKSKKNTIKNKKVQQKLTDDYDTNNYNFTKLPSTSNLISPAIWFNPDDGIKIGLKNTISKMGFDRNPFTNKHIISGYYYFATNGFELNYSGEVANIFKKWNLGFDAVYNSPNFARNFFGFGNNSSNPEAKKPEGNKDFNRVRIGKISLGSSLKWRGYLGALIKLGINYQQFDIERTPGRFLETEFNENNRIFSTQQFLNSEIGYNFKHSDNDAFPTLALELDTKFGYTYNINDAREFGYNITSLEITHKIIPNGKLVLATKASGHFNFGADLEFYQAASIGGNNGLRGFRNERFTGKNAFYHSSDLRWNVNEIKTPVIPLNIGIYGGFDYGLVWDFPTTLAILPNGITKLNTSYGGGIFINAANMIGGSIGLFHSIDGPRLSFNLGFDL